MKKIILILSVGIIYLLTFPSCKHQPPEVIPLPSKKDTIIKDTIKTGRPCNADTVYYKKDIQPIFTQYCAGTGCHSGARPEAGLDLTTYSKALGSSKIKPYNSGGSKVYQSLSDNMPPTGFLSAEKIAIIKKWIDQGSKNLVCDDITNPCDTIKVTYSNTISIIFKENCIGCHGYSGGVNLTSYNGVKIVIDNGKLWNSINHLSGLAKAMPNSSTKLSSCNLRQIKIWIDAGAPQN